MKSGSFAVELSTRLELDSNEGVKGNGKGKTWN